MPITEVTINVVVHNGEKYIRQCLDSIFKQTYPHEQIEINILDNNSTDSTQELIRNLGFSPAFVAEAASAEWVISDLGFAKFSSFRKDKNLGMWPGQEWLLQHSQGKYIVCLSVDVILDPDFIKNAIAVMERDDKTGALQGKVLKYELGSTNYENNVRLTKSDIIDTCGFEIYKSRRIVNIGHGELDEGQYNEQKKIFGVEGAVPVFRHEALEDIRIEGKVVDPDFFWYGDDLDITWRMNMFGWRQIYSPDVIAWHDRKTTKELADGNWSSFIKIRKIVPRFKRRLDYRNWLFTVIKNDYFSNIVRDFWPILKRQSMLWTYFIIFEPWMLLEIPLVIKMMPRMLRRRKEVMQKSKVNFGEISEWFR